MKPLIAYLDITHASQGVQNVMPPSSSPFPVKQLSAISGQQSDLSDR
jgi:hypothetical protein